MSNRLLDLIGHLYDAPGSEAGWLHFLDALTIALDGSGASFISADEPYSKASVALSARIDSTVLQAYRDYWGTRDPWARRLALRHAGSGNVMLGDELISHEACKNTDFYNDFGRQADTVRALIGTIESGAGILSVVSINGGERRRPFDEADARLLRSLMPHLQRALQLHRQLVDTRFTDLATIMDRTDRAIFFVTVRGRVTFKNRTADNLVTAADGLTIHAGVLRATDSASSERLRWLLADAAGTADRKSFGAAGALALSRSSGRRPLMVLVTPLSRTQVLTLGAEVATVMVIVADPDRTAVPDEHLIRAYLNLTGAEARLTRLLATGLTLSEAADRLGLQTATVRTRMKTVFEKTATHRQADLVRIVLSLPIGC